MAVVDTAMDMVAGATDTAVAGTVMAATVDGRAMVDMADAQGMAADITAIRTMEMADTAMLAAGTVAATDIAVADMPVAMAAEDM
jgi:hypothetical protein